MRKAAATPESLLFDAAAAAEAQSVALSSGWVSFLSDWRWQWFATLTFRTNVHEEAADRYFRTWVSKLNRKVAGHRWHKHPGRAIWWARASEPQKSGRLHFHALMGAQELHLQNRLASMKLWESLGCCANARRCRCNIQEKRGPGFARIEEPRDFEGAAVRAYCSKYATKGGTIDLGGPIAGAKNAWRTRQEHAPFKVSGRERPCPPVSSNVEHAASQGH